MNRLLPAWVGLLPLVVVLLVWQLAVPAASPNFPPPLAWWHALVAMARSGVLVPAVFETLWTFLAGLAIAIVAGFALGILIGTVRQVRDWSMLILEFMRALPPPVVVPIAVLMMGFAPAMKLTVIAITAAWPILLNTVAGVQAVPPLLSDVGRSMHMPWHVRVWRIVVPATVPALLVGVRVAVALAIVITLLIEIFTSLPGIGVLMVQGQRNYNSAQVFGLLALVGVLAYILTIAFALIEGTVLSRWPPRVAHR
jgi:ABC-type nitrate/sulfonate/bicarbonate transport system permease component